MSASPPAEIALVADAVARLYAAAGLPRPSPAGGLVVPVPLDRLVATYNLVHEEVPGLSRAAAAAYLQRWGIHRPELLEDATPLAGFLFANARGGYILVRREDNLPRRRFTAAHELGHYLLHFLPRLGAGQAPEAGLVQDDEDATVREEEAGEGEVPLAVLERQANRFAAEVLMPEEVCRGLRNHFLERLGPTARFLEHQLAGGLLVSREAARWRLRGLGLQGASPAG
jgi:hypothetical protein